MTEVERITDLNEISFPKLGIDFHIDPTAFSIGGLTIQWYGIIIVIGLLLAVIYCIPRMKRFGLDSDKAVDAIIGGVIGGIIGARIYYVLLRWDDYKDNLIDIFKTRNGGLAIYGGLIGSVAVGLLICHIKKVRKLPMLDLSVLGFLIGQSVGRWGNFVNQEAFGTNTDSILGMTGGRIQNSIINSAAYMDGDLYQKGIEISEKYAVHPCFLYESLWCLLGFIILAFWSKRRRYDGQLLLMYLTWYGIERFFVEGLRTDSLMLGNIRFSQALSAILVITSIILQIVMFFRVRRDPDRYKLYANTGEARLLLEESRRKHVGISASDSAVLDDTDDEIGILPDEDEDMKTFAAPAESVDDDVSEKSEEAVEDDDVEFIEYGTPEAEEAAGGFEESSEEIIDVTEYKEVDADETFAEKAEDVVEAAEDKAEDAARTVKEKAEETAEAAEDKVKDAAQAVKEKAEEVVEDAEDKAKDAAKAVKEKAEDIAEEVKDTAEEVGKTADEADDKYEHIAEAVDGKLTGNPGNSHSKKKKHRR
ncbi:MAG TPA: prolipoprotein diacylglyceryl transferase [Ruminococcus sp.]|nr:prolipoprotein diacylglyceryl transferase [Ruminococcus sp.]